MARTVSGAGSNSPKGTLVEAIQIEREGGREGGSDSPSLNIKLQNEMAKPRHDSVRREAADTSRIEKLKASVGIDAKSFLAGLH